MLLKLLCVHGTTYVLSDAGKKINPGVLTGLFQQQIKKINKVRVRTHTDLVV